MSSHHESGFFPKRVLDKPSASGPDSANSIFVPIVVDPSRGPVEPGFTATAPSDHPTETPTSASTRTPSREPSATATNRASETPEPTEAPPKKEILNIERTMRAYAVADPYSASQSLGELLSIPLGQIRIEVDRKDPDSGWVLDSKGKAVAYRLLYAQYPKSKGGETPQQEPIPFEIRTEDLQSSGLISQLPKQDEHIYTGRRMDIIKVTASGAGLSAKALDQVAQFGQPVSTSGESSPSVTELGIALGAGRLMQNMQEPMTRRRILQLAGGLLGGALLSSLGGQGSQESVIAALDSSAEPIPLPDITYNSDFRVIPRIDPAYEVPENTEFTVRSVTETQDGEVGVNLISLKRSPEDPSARIYVNRGSDGVFTALIRNEADGSKEIWELPIPDYQPEDNSLVEISLTINDKRDTITVGIFDINGEHRFSIPAGNNFNHPSFATETWALNPKTAAVYTAVHFKADPDRLSAVTDSEPPDRLLEIDALTHRTDAIQPDLSKKLWATSVGMKVYPDDRIHDSVPDWSRYGTEIDSIHNIFYVSPLSLNEGSLYHINQGVGITLQLSPYGFRELEAWLKSRGGKMLRFADIDSLKGGRVEGAAIQAEEEPEGGEEEWVLEEDSTEVANQVFEFLTALQLDRKPDSSIKLALKGVFNSNGFLSSYMLSLGNATTLPAKLNQTTPEGTYFDHPLILGDVILSESYVKNLSVTIGALIRGGLRVETLIANSVPPQGSSVEAHISGRERLAQAMKKLGVSVGSENVQGGDVPFAEEVRLNGPDFNPSGIASPSIISRAPEVGSPHKREPYQIRPGQGLVLTSAYSELDS